MRAYERSSQSNEPRRARSRSGSVTSGDAARILAFQRDVGNSVVAADLSGQVVQRADSDSDHGSSESSEHEQPTGGQSAEDRERRLSAEFGIRIGPAEPNGPHFTHRLLNRIESALRQLPIEDIRDNDHLVAIEMDPHPEGSASLYNPATRSIEVVRPVVVGGLRAPQWLYAALNTDNPVERWYMNRSLLAGYPGITSGGDRALGISGGSREVIVPRGGLVKFTVRHEVAHSVDAKVGWDPTLAQEEQFGGWRTYQNPHQIDPVATALLARSGLDAAMSQMDQESQESARSRLRAILHPARVRANMKSGALAGWLQLFNTLPAQVFNERSALATRFVQMAVAQPWTLDDGGSDILEVNGRIYHLDQYGDWVSYSAAQRQRRVSRYQFSTAKEWFAEAYEAYYDTKRPHRREQLDQRVREWFATIPRPVAAAAEEEDASRSSSQS